VEQIRNREARPDSGSMRSSQPAQDDGREGSGRHGRACYGFMGRRLSWLLAPSQRKARKKKKHLENAAMGKMGFPGGAQRAPPLRSIVNIKKLPMLSLTACQCSAPRTHHPSAALREEAGQRHGKRRSCVMAMSVRLALDIRKAELHHEIRAELSVPEPLELTA
jgi:hypothetical protein